MKKNKILINIENLSDIDKYKKIGINNFLFAVNYFSIGYNSFDINDIKDLDCNKYLLINRIFNSSDIDKFKNIVPLLNNFDGIIFEDIGVYNILKNSNIKLIWNQNHFATNIISINNWLSLVNSVVISNELTFEEVKNIIDNVDRPIILNVFGKNNIMYSRRHLLSNFDDYFNIKRDNEVIIRDNISKCEFLVREYDLGSVFFNNTYFNIYKYLNKFNDNNIMYYLIYPFGSSFDDMVNYINTGDFDMSDDGFMNKKTIYKLGDKK